jgi:hypothetical protein
VSRCRTSSDAYRSWLTSTGLPELVINHVENHARRDHGQHGVVVDTHPVIPVRRPA